MVRRGMGLKNGEQSTERCGVEGGVSRVEGFIAPSVNELTASYRRRRKRVGVYFQRFF